MKTVSLKITNSILAQIDEQMKLHHFSTRTEFIREAIRDKINELESQRFEKELRNLLKAKSEGVEGEMVSITEELTHDVFKELERRFG